MSSPHDFAHAARDAIAWETPYPFADVLALCVAQVSSGKGEERHGHGAPFARQHWLGLALRHSIGFVSGQSEKKWIEAQTSIKARDDHWYIQEVVGSIVYSLMTLIMLVDRDVARGRVSPQREHLSAAVWLAGVWPNEADFDAYQRQARWESPAFALHDTSVMIVLTRYQIFKMAEAVRARMAKMDPPMVVPPMRFPPTLSKRVA